MCLFRDGPGGLTAIDPPTTRFALLAACALSAACGAPPCEPTFVVGSEACTDPFGCAVDFGSVPVGLAESRRFVWQAEGCATTFLNAGLRGDPVFSIADQDASEDEGFMLVQALPLTTESHTAPLLFREDITFRLTVNKDTDP